MIFDDIKKGIDMKFDEVRQELKKVVFETLRADCDNNFEAVILRDELVNLAACLERFFGNPAWPSQNRMTIQMQEAIKGYGGIMPGQILYYWNHGPDTIFAMLWPWQDGNHTTVKVIKK